MSTATHSQDVEDALARIDEHKANAAPEAIRFWDIVGEAIKESGDPAGVLAEIVELIQSRLGGAPL